MKVAMTGATGLIGSALSDELRGAGHQVLRMVRREAGPGEVGWDPQRGWVDGGALRGVDAVVHLAAEPISPAPLTRSKRERLRRSRVEGTRTVATTLARLDDGPRVLLAASGVNGYGERGDAVVTEDDPLGDDGFLSRIVAEWESATEPARLAGLRVVHMRTGVVLDPDATILKVLGRITRMGGAAALGDGRQYLPWVTIDDVSGLYVRALDDERIEGPLNLTAPNPVTNEEFTRTLASVLHRPVLPVNIPRAVPSLYLGSDLARSLLFTSMRVRPAKALDVGYEFRRPDLEGALRAIYRREDA